MKEDSRVGWAQQVGAGWRPIVEKAILEIEELGGVILQVKEKFGGLRLYVGGDDGKIFEIADAAERACDGICEECGEPGILRGRSWIKTLCDKHVAPSDKDFIISKKT